MPFNIISFFIKIASSFSSILASLIGITLIVVFHEFGHFIFCKLFKVYTPTFSIGMGKILYSKMIGHTNFCLSLAPIGGYVEIASEDGIQGTKGFNEIPYYQKVLIMLGGIFCNFLFTYLIFVSLFFTGMPEFGLPYETNRPIISHLPEKSINAHHLKAGDIIISANDTPINDDASILKREALKQIQHNLTDLPVVIQRNNQTENINLLLNLNTKSTTLSNLLEVNFVKKAPLDIKNSFIQAYITLHFCLSSIINGLKNILHSSGKDFVGPIMIVMASSKSAQKGFSHFLLFLAIISLNLGFMNLLPLPIFDGGQFVIFTIEAIIKRSLSEKLRNFIGIGSWIFALGLMLIFSIKDLYHLFFK
ncbi:site-2 protease family protein [Candidatus Dependentiae bacterium]|nr:site-2 protease family protein [Candidatus Dependentiae bacterium]